MMEACSRQAGINHTSSAPIFVDFSGKVFRVGSRKAEKIPSSQLMVEAVQLGRCHRVMA